MYSNSRNDVPRVAQRYGTIAANMAYVLNKFIYTKLFWYDAEQGNNRCLCLSHIFNVNLWMGGVFLPHT